jgi:uncharacterized protein (DUF1684 family)
MDLDALLEYRSERESFLAEHYASPLPEEYQGSFEGLDWYPPDETWVVSGRFEPMEGRSIPIPSTAGTTTEYGLLGDAVVSLGGQEVRLAVVDDGDGGTFIPFRDATAGATTYEGGRYVRPDIHDDGTVTIDFNRAGNPWCVYDDEFTCPLPPPRNVVSLPIDAGEKMWRAPA